MLSLDLYQPSTWKSLPTIKRSCTSPAVHVAAMSTRNFWAPGYLEAILFLGPSVFSFGGEAFNHRFHHIKVDVNEITLKIGAPDRRSQYDLLTSRPLHASSPLPTSRGRVFPKNVAGRTLFPYFSMQSVTDICTSVHIAPVTLFHRSHIGR